MLGQYAVYTYIAPTLTDVVGLRGRRRRPAAVRLRHHRRRRTRRSPGSPLARRRRPADARRRWASAVAALVVLSVAPGVVPSIVAFAVWGLAFGAHPAAAADAPAAGARRAHQRDAASAFYTTAFNVGIGGGALVGAVLFERIGVQSLPFVYAAVLVVVALVLVGDAVRRAPSAGVDRRRGERPRAAVHRVAHLDRRRGVHPAEADEARRSGRVQRHARRGRAVDEHLHRRARHAGEGRVPHQVPAAAELERRAQSSTTIGGLAADVLPAASVCRR